MLWQMGTLVGAPFGICLLSAVALPAIFIAVPAYVGRRVSGLIVCLDNYSTGYFKLQLEHFVYIFLHLELYFKPTDKMQLLTMVKL